VTPDPKKVLVNFRLPPSLVEAIDQAASRAGLNRTEWVASTLTMAAREVAESTARAAAARVPGADFPPPGMVVGCGHPKSRRARAADGTLWCMDCRTVLERQRQGA
jgi:hypothetical protein